MTILFFPNEPEIGDLHTEGGQTWQWTGDVWEIVGDNQGVPPHLHDINDVGNLQQELESKADMNDLLAVQTAFGDLDAAKANKVHKHAIEDVRNLRFELDTKADNMDLINFQTAFGQLDQKVKEQVTALMTSLPTPEQIQEIAAAAVANGLDLDNLITKPMMMELAQHLADWFKPIGDNQPGAVLVLAKPGYEYQAKAGDFTYLEPIDYLGHMLQHPDAAEFIYQTMISNSGGFVALMQDFANTFATKPDVEAVSNTLLASTSDLQGKIQAAQNSITAVGNRTTTLESTTSALSTRLQAAEGKLVTAEGEIAALKTRVAALEPGPWLTPTFTGAAHPGNSTLRFRLVGDVLEFRGEVFFYPSIPDGMTVDFASVGTSNKPSRSFIDVRSGTDGKNVGAYVVEVLNGTGSMRVTTNGQECFRLSMDGLRVNRS